MADGGNHVFPSWSVKLQTIKGEGANDPRGNGLELESLA